MRKLFFFFLLLFTFLFSCEKVYKDVASPKFEFTQEKNKHLIDALEPTEIKLASGTKIMIPASVFVDKMGMPYSGKVAIEFEEYHDATDIILSGITMKYDSAGKQLDFQTAGMFSFNAFSVPENQAGVLGVLFQDTQAEPLSIAPGKEVAIEMASFAEDDGYNFYQLDSEINQWGYLQTVQKVENKDKTALLDSAAPIPASAPIEPLEPLENLPVIQLSFNKSKFPGLKEFNSLMWQYVGENENNDPSLPHNQWIFDKKWGDMSLNKKAENVYTLVLSDNGQTTSFDVRPVLFGNDLEKAKKSFDKEIVNYSKVIKKRQEKEEQMKSVANFKYLLKVANFGTYNVDKIYTMPNLITAKANFSIKGKPDINIENLTFFHITGSSRVVINYKGNFTEKFIFSGEDKNSLMVVLPNNGVAVLDHQKFKQLTKDNVSKIENLNFELNPLESVNSATELKSILKNI